MATAPYRPIFMEVGSCLVQRKMSPRVGGISIAHPIDEKSWACGSPMAVGFAVLNPTLHFSLNEALGKTHGYLDGVSSTRFAAGIDGQDTGGTGSTTLRAAPVKA